MADQTPANDPTPVTTTREPLGRNVKVVSLVSFLQDTASEILYPVLPFFVTGVLGGSIQVQSTLGQGTRFQLRIPRFAPRLQQTTSGTTGENRQPAGLERS